MNKIAYNVLILFFFLSQTLIVIGNWHGVIRFGLGLGDLVYVGVIGLTVVVGLIVYLRAIRSDSFYYSIWNRVFMIFCASFFIFILLKMTLLRGSESSWDGKIFFI